MRYIVATDGSTESDAAARYAATQATALDAALEVETELLTGRPANAITGHARAVEADAIYVGHRGISEEHASAVGSVAKSVVDRAPVPVTIVR